MHNYPLDKLIEYHEDPTVPMPEFILRELKNGRKVFHSVDFDQIFGFNTLNLIQDQDRAASYIAKYLTKSDGESPFKTRVWHSRGLQQAQKIKKYHIPTEKNAVEELFDIMRKLASVTASGRPLFEEHYTTGISIPVSATCLINQSDMTVGEVVQLLDNMLGDEV